MPCENNPPFETDEYNWEITYRSFLTQGGTSDEISPKSAAILSALIGTMPTGIAVVDKNGVIMLINDAAIQLFDMIGPVRSNMEWSKIVESGFVYDQAGSPVSMGSDPVAVSIARKESSYGEVTLKMPNSIILNYIKITSHPVLDADGELMAAVATMEDISDFKEMQDVIYYKATHDSLTDLPNRAIFSANIGRMFAGVKRGRPGGALMVIGVDRLKKVNESLGHSVGDELLCDVAGRIRAEVRETDMVARIHGDEFCVLVSDISGEDSLQLISDVADRICRSVANIFSISGKEVHVTVSVGISIFPADGLNEMTLFEKANSAMRIAKNAGRNSWKFWRESELTSN
jgi:diguanylate cyclase (GGDEF)-like protein